MSFRNLDVPERDPQTWSFALRGATVDVVNVERTLWMIFTYHTLHGDPNLPEQLTFRGFLGICKECHLVDEKRVLSADVHVIFQAQTSKRGQRQLDFPAFLDALLAVSSRIEKGAAAFQQLVRNQVIGSASCRESRPLAANEGQMPALRRELGPGLEEIFSFYASASARAPPAASSSTKSPRNRMNDALQYSEFRNFALDFGLAATDLSAIDLGEVFLSELAEMPNFDPSVVPGKLDFEHFWRALVRCAQLAFARHPVDDSRRLKSLFTHCWRAIQEGVPKAIAERRITQTYAGGLMQGSARFSARFVAMWKQDGAWLARLALAWLGADPRFVRQVAWTTFYPPKSPRCRGSTWSEACSLAARACVRCV
jgi:hypothetical protein